MLVHDETRPVRRSRWRRLAQIGLVAAAVAVVGAVAVGFTYARAATSNVGALEFTNALVIPPVLSPQDGAFDLTVQEGRTELVDDVSTDTWGVNGAYLGPTLRAARGDHVTVRVHNTLREPTTMHWHGMRLPARMDGGPHQHIPPGATWEASWTVDQPASTLWYHPHPHGSTAEHVYRGIAGMFIVDDESSPHGLPAGYGVDDVPVIVQDRAFGRDGSLSMREGPLNLVGVLGDEVLVNGTHDPYFEASTTLVRLRVLNASNARVYNFGFDDDRTFALVATDSGLLASPVRLGRLQLTPGERAEIVVEVEPAERTVLRSYPPDLGMRWGLARLNGGGDTFDILQIRARQSLRASEPLPSTLTHLDRLDERRASVTRTFELGRFSRINGREMDMGRIDFSVQSGDVEIWEIHNPSINFHNLHIHLVHFQILDVDGASPPPELSGWKDTVAVPPGSVVRVIAAFDASPDPVPFMFHCHMLEHEDAGMMGQFTVR